MKIELNHIFEEKIIRLKNDFECFLVKRNRDKVIFKKFVDVILNIENEAINDVHYINVKCL